jgi:hypothetical protein
MSLPLQAAPISRGAIGSNPQVSGLLLSDTCVGVVINSSGQVCLSVPVVGNVCIPIHTPFPSGTAAQACISTCGSFIPTGACVTVSVLGQQVARQCFGLC